MVRANQEAEVSRYSRQDVLRILHLHPRQIAAWERVGLVVASDDYSFEELGSLRKLRDLQGSSRISSGRIRASVEAMKRVAGIKDPLIEASAVRRGKLLLGWFIGTPVREGTSERLKSARVEMNATSARENSRVQP